MFENLLNFLSGKVHIVVEGFFIEKFINICINKKILLNNINIENGCILNTNVNIKDYKRLKQVCKKTGCKMKIVKKVGLPFIINRYRKRKLIFFFSIIVVALLIYANSLIWKIQVINSDDLELNTNILNTVESLGIQKFTNKYKVNKDYIANELIIKLDKLSWVEIGIKGVTLNIDIRKRIDKPDIVEKDEICNIIATKPGVIEKIIARSGNAVVKKGDVVDKGDLLISGIIGSEHIEDMFVHSEGEVYARVWFSQKIEVPLYEKKVTYTGKEKNVYGTNLKNIKFFLGKLSTNYKEYDTILNEKSLSVGKIKTNVKFYEYIIREKNTQIIERTNQEAIDYAIEILKKDLNENLNSDIILINERKLISNNTDSVQVELIYECLQQIGTKEKIN